MKKICLLFLFVFLLSGCSGTNAKKENQIQQDIEAHYLWQDLKVNTTSFTVEKRQTNPDTKEDIVYITMTGEGDGYTTEQFYIATYRLYNEGWILDNLEVNEDREHHSTVTPTKGVDISSVQGLLEFYDFLNYSSFNTTRVDRDSSPVETEQYLADNYGMDVYTIECRYSYNLFTEVVQFPIVFRFGYLDSDVGYGWTGYVDVMSADRYLELNDGILGNWTDSSWPNPFYADVTFSNLDGNRCWCDFSSYTYNGSRYITGKKTYSGWVTLHYEQRTDTGTLDYVELVFDSDEGVFDCVLGEYFTMKCKSFTTGYVTSDRKLEFHKLPW